MLPCCGGLLFQTCSFCYSEQECHEWQGDHYLSAGVVVVYQVDNLVMEPSGEKLVKYAFKKQNLLGLNMRLSLEHAHQQPVVEATRLKPCVELLSLSAS